MRSNFRFIGCLRLVLINVTIIVVTWEPKCFSWLRCVIVGRKGIICWEFINLMLYYATLKDHNSPWRGGWEGSEAKSLWRNLPPNFFWSLYHSSFQWLAMAWPLLLSRTPVATMAMLLPFLSPSLSCPRFRCCCSQQSVSFLFSFCNSSCSLCWHCSLRQGFFHFSDNRIWSSLGTAGWWWCR